MLVEVDPREWLTLSEDRRSNLYVAYLTYLRGLSFPTQNLVITTSFDAEQYYEQFTGPKDPVVTTGVPADGTPQDEGSYTGEATDAGDASIASTDGGLTPDIDLVEEAPLLEYGRQAHPAWLAQTLANGEVRDRRFFVAVAVNKGETDDEGEQGPIDRLREKLPVGNAVPEIEDEAPYLEEVWARAYRVASQLPRTEVGTRVLDSRGEVLEVLYHYFRGTESPIDFDHAVFTEPDEETITDPASGEPLDLETAFEQADREDERSNDRPPERPKQADRPYEGRVDPDLIERVDGSRILRWYVRNVAPLGRSEHSSTPLSVYAGVATFLLAILCGISAFVAFGVSTTTIADTQATYWLLREGAFALAAGALPVFLLSLIVLIPSSRVAQISGLIGAVVTGVALYLFQSVYPALWDASDMTQTMTVLGVYGVGIFALIVAVGLAVRQRRTVLTANGTERDSETSESTTVSTPDSDRTSAATHPEDLD
ncbi:DUF7139 domain-containing protein (plasmid) [Halorientalis pallida]|uniref:DUF7139 domain-containing protein n=1 Tax=Halorientalis pallida TaxID=2479928 RepID=UPI003C6F1DFB